jgi:hypothetical protein
LARDQRVEEIDEALQVKQAMERDAKRGKPCSARPQAMRMQSLPRYSR